MSKDDDEKSALAPRLRFPEFREAGAWGMQRLRNVAQLLDGDWIESKDQSADGVRLIQTGNIGIGDFIPKDGNARFISEETFRRLKCTEVVPGDCLISRLPAPAGRSCLIPDMGSKMITAVDCTIVRFNLQEIDPYLFISFSQMDQYFSEVQAQASGSTRLRISKENLSNIEVPLASLCEQQKIADCLSSLDELITAETQKLDALKTHKKGLMQQLFPREGETVPRLRFREFREARKWEEKTLGEAATFYNGRAYAKEELLEGGKYKVIRVGNFFTSDKWYHSNLELDNSKYCDDGDLLYAWSASFGPRIWRGNKSIYHYHIWKVVENTGVSKDFLFIALDIETERMKARSANGIGMFHITKGTIENWMSVFPALAEQEKIARFLSSLDDLITNQIQKIDTLKIHKKGLMQQLFPVLDETPA